MTKMITLADIDVATIKDFNSLSRALRRIHKGLRFKVSGVGSLLALRIEDPTGIVTVKAAQALIDDAGMLLAKCKTIKNFRPAQGMSFHMDGIVANWLRD